MSTLFIVIVVIIILSSSSKKKKPSERNRSNSSSTAAASRTTAASSGGRRSLTYEERQKLNNYRSSKSGSASMSRTAQSSGRTQASGGQSKAAENDTAVRNVSQASLSAMEAAKYNSSTTKAVAERARMKKNANIVDLARNNTEKLKEDVTLEEIEKEHGHSEQEEAIIQEHSRHCQSLKDDTHAELAADSYLGTTEDLIIMGYSGNLQNQRNFLDEAQDFLTAISMQ